MVTKGRGLGVGNYKSPPLPGFQLTLGGHVFSPYWGQSLARDGHCSLMQSPAFAQGFPHPLTRAAANHRVT